MTEEQQQEESRIQVVGCAFILFAFCPVIITNMQVQNFELPGTLKFDLGVRCWDTLQIQIQIQIQMHIIMLSNQSMLKFWSDALTSVEAMDWSDPILHFTSPSHKDFALLY